MQIVIEIPEAIIKDAKDSPNYYPSYLFEKIWKAVANGTILPKGHGRIADMDEAIKCIEDVEGEDAIWAIGLIDWACSKRTIIEADRSE